MCLLHTHWSETRLGLFIVRQKQQIQEPGAGLGGCPAGVLHECIAEGSELQLQRSVIEPNERHRTHLYVDP